MPREIPSFLALWMAGFCLLSPCADAIARDVERTFGVRAFLESVAAGAEPIIGTRRLQSPDDLATFYQEHAYRHVWTGDGALAGALEDLLRAIEESAEHGLDPARYHAQALKAALQSKRATLAAELLASDAFLTQVRHRAAGVVNPADIDPEWQLARDAVDAPALLSRLVESGGAPGALLGGLWPRHREYGALLTERRRILRLPESDGVVVPPGPALKLADSGPRVQLLKQRLFGPGEHTPDFDTAVQAAVEAFQQAAGVDVDGVVGPATLDLLNATRFSWIDRIDVNLERWRWLPDLLPDTYLRVNIAGFVLRAIEGGRESLSMKVIVGRPYRRTPVFQSMLRYLVLNPYWNLPSSIARRDKLPLLQKDAQALADQGYEVRPRGAETYLPVTSVDWSGVSAQDFGYDLRQRPGPRNALGHIKFMLPNEHAVYLHATPDVELFAKQERGFSSGCIRLAEPDALARWLLEHDGRADLASGLAAEIASGETHVHYLATPVPVVIGYFTAFLDGETIQFRRDLYNRDGAILRELRSLD
jgi:murein L,D-transpeptidase YcbB/YkuD